MTAIALTRTLTSDPRRDGYRMPGEFEPHSGCWMLWPERTDNWRPGAALLALAALCAGPVTAAFAAGPAPVFDRGGMDTTYSPCRDFDQYANGGWKRDTKIPPTLATWGSFTALAERNLVELRGILEEAVAGKPAPGSNAAKLGTFYSTCMDSGAAEAAGARPIQPLMSAIDGMKDRAALAGQVAWLHAHGLRGVLFAFMGMPDRKNSDMTIANAGQGGIVFWYSR